MKLIRPQWSAPAGVHAICTTRLGGVSEPPYHSFNLSPHVGDSKNAVSENRKRLGTVLPAPPCWLRQAHTSRVMRAEQVMPDCSVADAAYTFSADVVCAVICADCIPVLFCSADGAGVAAAHAGWRGLAAGVLENTAALLRANGAGALLAWIGPAISAEHYEVGEEVRTAICRDAADEESFTPVGKGKWLADLPALARRRLDGLNIVCAGYDGCTFTDARHFFSARRQAVTGRMAALIWRAKSGE